MTYTLEGPKWGSAVRGTTATITWSFADLNLTDALSRSFPGYPALGDTISANFRGVIRNAFSTWAGITGISFVEASDSSASNIRIGQADIDGDGPTLGETTYWASGATFLKAAVDLDEDAFENLQELYAVSLHEIGHAIGLGHASLPEDVMYPYLSAQNQTNLSIDDMTGARVLYAPGLTLQGSATGDLLSGGQYADLIFGQQGSDTIFAAEGNNTVVGGADSTDGADMIMAGIGSDLIFGNGGNDSINSTGGNDVVAGGAGNDLISLGSGNDVVYGNAGNDVIDVGDGNDQVSAGQGDDIVRAGAGADTLWGNAGDDVITGGSGADLFVFGAANGADRITDFNIGQGDRIGLSGLAYQLSASTNGDAMLIVAGGGTVQLEGIAPSSLTGSWIA